MEGATLASARRRRIMGRGEHPMTHWYYLGLAAAVIVAVTFASHATPQAAKEPLRVCLISGSAEYNSDASLARLQEHLQKHHAVKCSRAFARSDSDLPGLENLDSCDVAVLFTRRLKLQGEQLERIKKYCRSGKPLVGIRTASHAIQTWLDLDHEVFGGDYQNHYKEGPLTEIKIVPDAKDHPVLKGFEPYRSAGSLYKNPAVAKDVTILLTGTIPGHTEPIAWTRLYKGGRVFYTSLGHQRDFAEESYLRLLTHAIFWTAKRAPR
jgi:type 1 glutamine amidotransferase